MVILVGPGLKPVLLFGLFSGLKSAANPVEQEQQLKSAANPLKQEQQLRSVANPVKQEQQQIPGGKERKKERQEQVQEQKPIRGSFPFAALEGQDDGEKQVTATTELTEEVW
jgi:hypothetical protein